MSIVAINLDKDYKVGKIVCVGQNYAKHITEMASEKPDKPVLFLKPSTAIINEGNPILLPAYSKEIHHEIELALLIGKEAKSINSKDWKKYVAGAGIALDLTLRDIQSEAKKKGLPWSVCKGFDGACPISNFTSLDQIPDINNLEIKLYVNDQLKQHGNSNQMIFPPDNLVAYISSIFTLEPGDIILTGTPSGVGPILKNDNIKGEIEHLGQINFKVE